MDLRLQWISPVLPCVVSFLSSLLVLSSSQGVDPTTAGTSKPIFSTSFSDTKPKPRFGFLLRWNRTPARRMAWRILWGSWGGGWKGGGGAGEKGVGGGKGVEVGGAKGVEVEVGGGSEHAGQLHSTIKAPEGGWGGGGGRFCKMVRKVKTSFPEEGQFEFWALLVRATDKTTGLGVEWAMYYLLRRLVDIGVGHAVSDGKFTGNSNSPFGRDTCYVWSNYFVQIIAQGCCGILWKVPVKHSNSMKGLQDGGRRNESTSLCRELESHDFSWKLQSFFLGEWQTDAKVSSKTILRSRSSLPRAWLPFEG